MPLKDADDARAVLASLRLRMEPIYPALLAAAQNRKHAAWTPGQRSRVKAAVQRGDVTLDFSTFGGAFVPVIRIAQLKQEAALACGLDEEAADLSKVLFACSDLAAGDSSVIGFLIRITMDQVLLDAARRSMSEGKLSAVLVAEYQTFFAARPYAAHLDRAIRMELAGVQYLMKQVVKQQVPLDAFQAIGGIDDYRGKASLLTQGITHTFFDLARALHIRYHLSGLQALKSGGMLGYYRWAKDLESALKPGPLDVLRPYHMFVAGAMSGYSALMPATIYKEMSRRVFVVECALERHRLAGGMVPETLDALPKDLLAELPLDLDGKPIRYRREKTAWVLWSVGLDLVDEVKPDAALYPPKAGTRDTDPHLATDWRWWHVNP